MNGESKVINNLNKNPFQNDFDLFSKKNEANLIPLKLIYERVIQNYYSELKNLSETLPTKTNSQKKVEIFKLAQNLNQCAIKLLVLIRWAKQSKDVLRCKSICNFLAAQNSYFREAADALHMVHQEMNLTRIPTFDIPTAVDVLTTGTYSHLPSMIKEPMDLSSLKNEEIKDAIEKLEDVTRLRLLCDEIIPKPMKKNYSIENGSVKFIVENEFEVTLKLEGKQQNQWKLLDLKIFVQPDDELNQGYIIQDIQISNLKTNAQNTLKIDTSKTDLSSNSIKNTSTPNVITNINNNTKTLTNSKEEEKSSKKIWPLIELYRCLHSYCLSMQLEILLFQIGYLIKTKWANRLKFNISKDKKTLQLFYWIENESGRSKDTKNKEVKKSNILELSITSTEDKIMFCTNKEDKEEGTTISTSSTTNTQTNTNAQMNINTNTNTNTDNNGLLITKSQSQIFEYEKYIQNDLTIQCYQLLPDGTKKELIDPSTSSKVKIIINPRKLNIEKILDYVTEVHAFAILFELRNILIGKSNSKIAIHKCNSNDIRERNFFPYKTNGNKKDKPQPELIVCYRINHYVRITVDRRTGRIVINEYNEQGTNNANNFIQEKIKIVEEQINKDMFNAVDYLMNLRNLTIINEIEILSIYLGLEPSKKLLIQQEELKRLMNSNELFLSQSIIYLKYPNYPNYYIIIYIDNEEINSSTRHKHDVSYFKVWLVCTQKKNSSGFLGFTLIMNLDISQLLENDNTENDSDDEYDDFHHLRKRRCIEEPSVWDKTKNLILDQETLSRIEAVCRYKIAYCLLTTQLKDLHIPYYFVSFKSNNHVIDYDSPLSVFDLVIKIRVKDIIPDVVRKCVLGDYILKLNNDLYITATGNTLAREPPMMIPFEKISNRNQVKGMARGIEVVAKLQVKSGELPINEDFSIGDINFSVKTKVLTFTYSKINDCIRKILNIWKGLVMLRIIASQAYTNRDILENHGIYIDKINLLKTKILFYEKNFVEFALNSSLDNVSTNGINIIFGVKGDNKATVFYKEKQFLIEDFLKDYNVINFLLKLKTKFKLFKNINSIIRSREIFNTYSPLIVNKESLEKIKLIYNNQYTIEIGQCTDNLVGILYSAQSKINIIPQFQLFIEFVSQLHATNAPPKKINIGERENKENKEKENIKKESEKIEKMENDRMKEEEQGDCICLKIPNGIIFDIKYIDQVMDGLNKLMDSVSYMDWLYYTINQIEATKTNKGTVNYSKTAKEPLLLNYIGESLELTLSYNFNEDKWLLQLKSNDESINGDKLIEKILKLKNPIMGLKNLTQLMVLPPAIAKEILILINSEKKVNQHNVTSEICLTVPEGLPHYLPNAGESSIYTDFENKRIGLFCQFSFNDPSTNGQSNEASQTKHTIVIPFFYNWESRFFCEWNANPELSKLKTNNDCKSWLQSDPNRKLSKLNVLLIQITIVMEKKKVKEAIRFAFSTLSSMPPEKFKAIEDKNS
ncbi:MED14-domain-containing protein [Neocallimastix lanati (nom. inval.)]|nr:MED14-domain-containing protein [Neocallimastix sp. JGI-2020a]